MWGRCRQALLLLSGLILLCGLAHASFSRVAAQDGSAWLVNDAPSLSSVVSLPANLPPNARNIDCADGSFVPGGERTPQQICTFQSPLGTITTDSLLQTGTNQFVNLYGQIAQSTFLPTADPSLALISIPATTFGDNVGVYHGLTKAALQLNIGVQGNYYLTTKPPDALISDPVTHKPLEINTADMAFSANGQWMVANMPHEGLLRVNLEDLSTKLFAAPVEPDWYQGLATLPLAVSNDGRYVAANTDIFSTGNLIMYDLSTCDDQLDVPLSARNYCNGKNIWEGKKLNGQPMGQGLLNRQPDLAFPVHLRFVNEDSISFNARYAVAPGGVYKAATFLATAPGVAEHKLGLLGLGDSYISGQGAFEYVDGTDTANNTCHLSRFSYPFLLGTRNFNSSNSIACSGALTRNVAESVDSKADFKSYPGQVNDKIREEKRDKASILANFLPGYIYQQEFAAAYQPEAMLLSVGGDDIGFANIVKRCVANLGGDTCYDTYEDRVELVNEINAIYPKLVNTYKTLREQSGGARLYVVGYPLIAMPGGSCGLNVHLNSAEVEFSAQIIDYLDTIVQKAAQTAGVFYVDTQHAFDGHRLCESGDKAINGLTAGNDAGTKVLGHTVNVLGAESYHPTQLGYELLANIIARSTQDLTAPMPTPTAYNQPNLDPSAAILRGVPTAGRAVSSVANDDTIASDLILRGGSQSVMVSGNGAQLRPGSTYQVVLHSEPILLDEGGVDADGNIDTTVHIPGDVPAGFHVLHVYGTNLAGQPVDIQKTVYVAVNADDYDGDGVPNSASSCLLLPASGQDVDQDDVDDACDPDIRPAPAVIVSAQTQVATNQATTAGNVSDSPRVAHNDPTTPAPGTVLGSATTVTNPQTVPQIISLATVPADLKLFRLNWWAVAETGAAGTFATTLLYYCIRRG